MKTKNLPPYAPTLIESTRAIGYSLEAAVADIIDNSIAANANRVDISFFPIDGAYVAILDNGKGMNEEELDLAMQYGSKNPSETRDSKDLGRFGLGLKTASLSQCRCLSVVTKQGDNVFGRRWDIDHVSEVGEWSLLILDEEEMSKIPQFDSLMQCETGTLVVWQKLDRLKAGEINFELALGRKIDSVREHLSLVYHRYLSGETGITKLYLSINGQAVQPLDPFLKSKSTQPMDDEVLVIRGQKIIVRPYILPHISRMSQEQLASVQIIVLGQAKCTDPTKPVNGKDIARTVARMKRGWIGAFVTTSYFSEPVQQEVKEDSYPLMMINGAELVSIVERELFESKQTLDQV